MPDAFSYVQGKELRRQQRITRALLSATRQSGALGSTSAMAESQQDNLQLKTSLRCLGTRNSRRELLSLLGDAVSLFPVRIYQSFSPFIP
jgi:hypothetical protein